MSAERLLELKARYEELRDKAVNLVEQGLKSPQIGISRTYLNNLVDEMDSISNEISELDKPAEVLLTSEGYEPLKTEKEKDKPPFIPPSFKQQSLDTVSEDEHRMIEILLIIAKRLKTLDSIDSSLISLCRQSKITTEMIDSKLTEIKKELDHIYNLMP